MRKLFILMTLTFYITSALKINLPDNDKVNMDELNQLFGIDYNGQIYSGYLNANLEGTVQFHYLFYPSIESADEKPVILWLHGGPGCSSLISAFTEQGPFVLKEDSIEFEENKDSWIQFANLLYIESPIGVGYSYGPTQQQSDESTAQFNIHALVDFFAKFPIFQTQKFYIGGLSYGGIFVPYLAQQIIQYNENPTNVEVLRINLQGIIIVNGCTDPTECTNAGQIFPIHRLNFFGRHGFISESIYQKVLSSSEKCYGVQNEECSNIYKEVNQQIYGDDFDILENGFNIFQKCFTYTPEGSSRTQLQFSDSKLNADILFCTDVRGLYHWLQNDQTRRILNIKQESPKWVQCAFSKMGDYQRNPNGSYYLYSNIIQNNIRVLQLSGDVDSVVPITGTLYWIKKLQEQLNLQTIKSWRPWYVEGKRQNIDQDQIGGNVFDLEGLTFVSMRNAGHFPTSDQRYESTVVIKKFLRQEYL